MDPGDTLKHAIETEARALGFAAVGVTRPDAVAQAGARLRAWVADGQHGEMGWMADRIDWRADPGALWPAARSVIMLADAYTPAADPMAVLDRPRRAAISVYAQGVDYHDTVKKRLKRLGRWLIERAGGEIKVFVDTAPVMEKPLAAAAGVGWQGKHTNLVARDGGSWFFLGAIFTTLDLPPDAPGRDHCGACRRCLDICPTDAFPAPYRLDARRCISYLTIELKGPIPRELRPLMGNRIYGCDDCLAVCPWNKFALAANAVYRARPETGSPRLADIACLDDAGFREVFAGSPIKRIGRGRFLRNVAVAIGNSGEPRLIPSARRLARDADPLVRAHGVWALGRLLPPEAIEAEAAAAEEADPMVLDEWTAAVSRQAPSAAG
ncbi:tRNA epoxyqueuosine(34) reductase QueG [Limibaculum sp. M0105]|uniref:Epoxyqueuosine reductase n=1 Tax=Thermohalobaculum xanthum TaxID=2753746 RepID=A0A8J7MAM9_9RHOB|nr:tRNA epoxyqueuosine(34) reductase QueG [Thermohalobaculum xanthum]MBK0400569.1 tRNA epoxyqueuosine(34) reductase QueG [Thermohalobaculum xanthum]